MVNSVAMRFINSVIVMSFILHPVVVRPSPYHHHFQTQPELCARLLLRVRSRILVVGFECEELDVLRHRPVAEQPATLL